MVFHTLDSICYVGDISGTNGDDINCVTLCGGFTQLQPYMHWTIQKVPGSRLVRIALVWTYTNGAN